MADIVKFLKEQKVKETGAFSKGVNKGLNIAISAIKNPEICPTIEQPQWISVDDARKPELIPCEAGTAYSEAVNVLTSERKVITAIWNGTDFIGDAAFWEAEDEEITHWAPVLLPLPEPPKGDE